jgi:hypothetical protein
VFDDKKSKRGGWDEIGNSGVDLKSIFEFGNSKQSPKN